MTPEQQDSLTITTVIKDDLPGFLRTAASISIQSNQDFEWLIVDGSNPKIQNSILDSINLSCKVRLIHREPKGIYNAMNHGLREAKNNWIWYLNAGDFLIDSESTKKAMSLIKNSEKESLIATRVIHFTENKKMYSVTVPNVIESAMGRIADFHHQGVLVKKSAALSIEGFDEKLKMAADGKFLDTFINHFKYKISDAYMSGFVIGGSSLQNFQLTVKETATYRPGQKYDRKFLLFKSKIRLLILAGTRISIIRVFPLLYLLFRDRKIKKRYRIS
jgi:glycosyltransferase involved in cell wall biosynthesis